MTGGSSGGSGAAVGGGLVPLVARLRHQRLDPRAVLAVRHFRDEADLWALVARRAAFHLLQASTMSARLPAARAISRWPTTPCRAAMPTIRPAPAAQPSRSRRCLNAASTACALRSPAAISQVPQRRAARRRSIAWRRRSASTATSKFREAERARSAAFIITASEGASLHLDRLRTRRERLRSGGARPSVRGRACRRRRWSSRRRNFAAGIATRFSNCSTGSTPFWRRRRPARAPLIGQETFMLDDAEIPVRANLGLYTQPISFIGLPVVAVPVRA